MKARNHAVERQQSTSQVTTIDAKHKTPSLAQKVDLLYINPKSPAELEAQLNAVPFHLQVLINADCDISIFETTAEKLSKYGLLLIDPGMPGKPGTSIEKILSAARKLGEGRGLELPYNIAIEDLPKVARELQGKRIISFQPKNTPLDSILSILPFLNSEVELFVHPRNKYNIQSKDLDEVFKIIKSMKVDTLLLCSQRLSPWKEKISSAYYTRPALSAKNTLIPTGLAASITSSQGNNGTVDAKNVNHTFISTSLATSSIRVEVEDKISIQDQTQIAYYKHEIYKSIKNKKYKAMLRQFEIFNNLMQKLNRTSDIFHWMSRSRTGGDQQQLIARVISNGWMDVAEVMLDAVPKDKLDIVFNRLYAYEVNNPIKNQIGKLESKMQSKRNFDADAGSNFVSNSDTQNKKSSKKRAAELKLVAHDGAEPKRPKAVREEQEDDITENLSFSNGVSNESNDLGMSLLLSSHASITQQLSSVDQQYQSFVGLNSNLDHSWTFSTQTLMDEHAVEGPHLHDDRPEFAVDEQSLLDYDEENENSFISRSVV